ncbi:hypothetical protein [Clostridium tunisiense]|uniref:hypothetical protein n=1 Tax=Clostridium tunisiense TaxID=219748 RepID=UPI0002E3AAB3|nr:hypothetical protein [Clostridium tunisiense]
MNIKCDTTFHNVGQGMFYSGCIYNKESEFSFVYDCGTHSSQKFISWEIEDFHWSMKRCNNILNLLVLSHFDGDHVNQLDKLLSELQVETIVIPYVDPIERLIISLKYPYELDSYYEFLSDPINYLLDKGVKQIIVMGGDKTSNEVILEDKLYDLVDNELNITLRDDNEFKNNVLNKELIERTEKLLFKTHDGFIIFKNLWLFRFFNYSCDQVEIDEFYKLLKAEGYDVSSTEKIIEIVVDKVKRRKLKKIYKKVWEINNTSIIMFHGPLPRNVISDNYVFNERQHICANEKKYRNITKRHCYNLYSHYKFDRVSIVHQQNLSGTILFGDITLRSCYKEIIKHFKHFLNSILIVQVPHHGSSNSWSKEILDDINDFSFWIVPFGIYNRYNHPDNNIISKINELSPSKIVIPNTECHKIYIKSSVQL